MKDRTLTAIPNQLAKAREERLARRELLSLQSKLDGALECACKRLVINAGIEPTSAAIAAMKKVLFKGVARG